MLREVFDEATRSGKVKTLDIRGIMNPLYIHIHHPFEGLLCHMSASIAHSTQLASISRQGAGCRIRYVAMSRGQKRLMKDS